MNRFSAATGAVIIGLLCAVVSEGQTKISLKDQSRDVDFTNASATRPVKVGGSLPVLCSVGDLFLDVAAVTPANLFGCVTGNTWIALGASELPAVGGQTGRVLTTDGASVRWQLLDGDVSGVPEDMRVVRLQNRAVANTAPADGQVLTWNTAATRWEPHVPASGSGTNITLQNDGTVIGIQPAWNILPGTGLSWTLVNTGSALTLQADVNTAVVQTRGGAQSGGSIFCPAVGTAGGTQFTCSLAPALTTYTPGMVLRFQPSIDGAAGAITLNVDTLGSKNITLEDGVSNPTAGTFVAGRLYQVWYDGTRFRLM